MLNNSFACAKTIYSLGHSNVEYPYGSFFVAFQDAIEVNLDALIRSDLLLPVVMILCHALQSTL